MNPSYHNMQFVILDKCHRQYDYGDVIAFYCDGLNTVLVKRIAAVPGDEVQISNHTLYVNGEISKVYAVEGSFHYAGLATQKMKIPEGQYFVIGDNVGESKDSRYEIVGLVREDSVIGKTIK